MATLRSARTITQTKTRRQLIRHSVEQQTNLQELQEPDKLVEQRTKNNKKTEHRNKHTMLVRSKVDWNANWPVEIAAHLCSHVCYLLCYHISTDVKMIRAHDSCWHIRIVEWATANGGKNVKLHIAYNMQDTLGVLNTHARPRIVACVRYLIVKSNRQLAITQSINISSSVYAIGFILDKICWCKFNIKHIYI